jgi:hypothetical protein
LFAPLENLISRFFSFSLLTFLIVIVNFNN